MSDTTKQPTGMNFYQKQPHQAKFANPTNNPVVNTLSMLCGKWKMVVFYSISTGVNRFGSIIKAVPDISKRMLTKELRELEMDGLVSRKVFAEVPPRVEYTLTQKGKSLTPIVQELEKWGNENF